MQSWNTQLLTPYATQSCSAVIEPIHPPPTPSIPILRAAHRQYWTPACEQGELQVSWPPAPANRSFFHQPGPSIALDRSLGCASVLLPQRVSLYRIPRPYVLHATSVLSFVVCIGHFSTFLPCSLLRPARTLKRPRPLCPESFLPAYRYCTALPTPLLHHLNAPSSPRQKSIVDARPINAGFAPELHLPPRYRSTSVARPATSPTPEVIFGRSPISPIFRSDS